MEVDQSRSSWCTSCRAVRQQVVPHVWSSTIQYVYTWGKTVKLRCRTSIGMIYNSCYYFTSAQFGRWEYEGVRVYNAFIENNVARFSSCESWRWHNQRSSLPGAKWNARSGRAYLLDRYIFHCARGAWRTGRFLANTLAEIYITIGSACLVTDVVYVLRTRSWTCILSDFGDQTGLVTKNQSKRI